MDELVHQRLIALRRDALERPETYMAMAEPHHDGGSGGRRFVPADQLFAGFNQRKCFGGVDAKRFEHFRRQYLAHAPFERQPSVAAPAVGGGARPLGPKVKQPVIAIAQLGEQKSASIANIGIVHTKLVAVIPQRQRFGHVIGQRLKTPEMADPRGVIISIQTNSCRPTVVAKTQFCFGKVGRAYGVTNFFAQTGDLRIRTVGRVHRFDNHSKHLGGARRKGKYGGGPHPPFA